MQRRRECDEPSDDTCAEGLGTSEPMKDFLALELLQKARLQLDPEDEALLEAHYVDEKTIQQIANERNLPWSTAKSRLDRVLRLLRVAMQSIVVAIAALVTKNARAQGARLARHVSHLLPHATQAACMLKISFSTRAAEASIAP
ncbi:MAG: sigma-70 family RNA polymerase sigma factor [Polyangiaceae bacterium]|nr:sigma-70 family RNA polymerase sigma factor [Polyangiaceae bacterium]